MLGWCGCASDWRSCVRDGSATCQKRREWGLIAGGDPRPFAFLEFNKPLSPGVLRKHCLQTASLFLHWDPGLRYFGPHSGVFCQFRLDNLQWGPIVAFSADLFCRFLLSSAFAGTSDWVSAECFCEGLWPGFGSGHFCEGLLQGILWDLSHDLLRRLAVDVPQRKSRVCVWARVSSCNENFVFASGAGHRPAANPRVCGRVNSHPVPNDGVSRSRPRRPAISGVK